jgi:hypothetical protein
MEPVMERLRTFVAQNYRPDEDISREVCEMGRVRRSTALTAAERRRSHSTCSLWSA